MAFLRDVSTSVWRYISPRKTQQRRDKPFKAPQLPIASNSNKDKSLAREMSPDSRVHTWDVKTPSPTFSSDDPTLLPPSPPTSLERPYTDFEGETLIDDIQEAVHKDDPDYERYDANEDTMVTDEGRYQDQKIDPEMERARREAQGKDLRAAGWTEDAIFLFQKLGMRGFEPILPYGWFYDFEALPADLFTRKTDKAFVKPLGSDWHAQKALNDLFDIGPRARDAVITDAYPRTPEWHIKRFVRNYNRWALRDAGLDLVWQDLSLFEVISAPSGTPGAQLESRMKAKLGRLAELWADAFSSNAEDDVPELPTLYGVMTSYTIMAFVSYDPMVENPTLRTVAIFDFGQEGYDVWNVLAVAIFVIHCRNRILELRDLIPDVEPMEEDDPDL